MTGLLTVEEAQGRLLALVEPLAATRLSLVAATGRYLSQPLSALRTQPAAALSAMDGYAIRFADLPGPWTLVERIAAGAMPSTRVGTGQAARIFTGAPLPEGSDTILVQEDAAEYSGQLRMTGTGPEAIGQHVRPIGKDFIEGTLLASPGAYISPGLIALAAMAGHAELPVRQLARIAVITTGDELVAPGAVLSPGQIPDSNSAMIAALLRAWPAQCATFHRIGDDRGVTIAMLAAAAAAHDVIVTVGGASVGDHDHIHAALTSLGAAPDFWKVAMRPGKPVLAARLGQSIMIGLPGNPASAFVTAHLFLRPLLNHLAGSAAPLPVLAAAPLAAPLGPGGARRDYLRAVLADGALNLCASQDSGFVTALAQANALVIREAGAEPVGAGTVVPYLAI